MSALEALLRSEDAAQVAQGIELLAALPDELLAGLAPGLRVLENRIQPGGLGGPWLGDVALALLARRGLWEGVKELDLRPLARYVSGPGLHALPAHLKHLEFILLRGQPDWSWLDRLTALEWLDLSHGDVHDEALGRLAGAHGLRHLAVLDCAVEGRTLGSLPRGLEALFLNHNALVTLTGLPPGLRKLWLVSCDLQGDMLSALRACPQLEQLSLAGLREPDTTLAALPPQPGLWRLDLAGVQPLSTARLARFIEESPGLTHLRLTRCGLEDGMLQLLSRLPGLVSLEVARCPGVTDDGLALLGELPALETLDVRGCGITHMGLKTLAQARPTLREVKLQQLDIRFRSGQIPPPAIRLLRHRHPHITWTPC